MSEMTRPIDRLRFLNGCQSRFLILDFSAILGVEVWQIGNEGGFLAEPVNITEDHGNQILLAPAERADCIVNFTNVQLASYVLRNVGPDEPFAGGIPGTDFAPADEDTTGQILQFCVVQARGRDHTTPPEFLELPAVTALPTETVTRRLALLEAMSVSDESPGVPTEALLGTVAADPDVWTAQHWDDPISENPALYATEVWEFYNTTGDAHPMHIHEVAFAVVNRQDIVVGEVDQTVELVEGTVTPPKPWETGFKDTVIAYPGQVTRVRMTFGVPGQFVWHCHILEHEDNEMMRPYRIGAVQPKQPPE